MRRLFVLLGITLTMTLGFAPSAQAQMIQFAYCVEGGCTCHITGMTVEDFEMTTGTTAPRDAETRTLVTFQGDYSWRNATPAQIDASFGGPGDCPVQLEPPLIPLDGMWRIAAGATDASACPLFALTGQAVPAQIGGETRQISWGGWFTPSKLMTEAEGMVDWTNTGGHSWRGVVVDERLAAGGGTTGASVIWQMTLVSPNEVSGTSVFDYDISSGQADAAALAILENMQCRTITPFTARRVG